MNARGTKIKASVEGLKVLIQKRLDADTAKHTKAMAEFDKAVDKWAEDAHKRLSAVTVADLKKRALNENRRGYRYDTWSLPVGPHPPSAVDENHQRLLNMLELTAETEITLSLDSEFRNYLS